MNAVDVIIAVFALALATLGYARGLIASGLPLVGFVVGAVAGGRLGPALLAGGGESQFAPLITVLGGLLLGAAFALMLEGVGDVADFQCRQILEDRYNRLAPVFPPGVVVDLDDAGKIDYLIAVANSVKIATTLEWLARVGW